MIVTIFRGPMPSDLINFRRLHPLLCFSSSPCGINKLPVTSVFIWYVVLIFIISFVALSHTPLISFFSARGLNSYWRKLPAALF